MAERAYTLTEVDELREACRLRYLYGTTKRPEGGRQSRSYMETDMEKVLTERMRQYMAAGITAKDIYEQDNK